MIAGLVIALLVMIPIAHLLAWVAAELVKRGYWLHPSAFPVQVVGISVDGIYIINMLSGPSMHELSQQMREKLNAQLVRDWQSEHLERGLEDGTVKVSFDTTVYQWVADQVD